MIKVINGKLFQWDTGRVVQVNSDVDIHEVHFTTKDMTYAYVVSTYEKDETTYCEIPNVILQQEKSLICYEVTKVDDCERTVSETILTVNRRNKPDGYIYTEDELKNFDRLEKLIPKKLSDLENDINVSENYNHLKNTPIINISGSSENSPKLYDLESGVYRLQGIFRTFEGHDDFLSFDDNQLVNIVKNNDGSHIQIFDPIINAVQRIFISQDEFGEYIYERYSVSLNDMVKTVNNTLPDENGNVQIESGGGALIVPFTSLGDGLYICDTDMRGQILEALYEGRRVISSGLDTYNGPYDAIMYGDETIIFQKMYMSGNYLNCYYIQYPYPQRKSIIKKKFAAIS